MTVLYISLYSSYSHTSFSMRVSSMVHIIILETHPVSDTPVWTFSLCTLMMEDSNEVADLYYNACTWCIHESHDCCICMLQVHHFVWGMFILLSHFINMTSVRCGRDRYHYSVMCI